MNEALHIALKGKIVVEKSNGPYEIFAVVEIKDGSHGPDTMIIAKEVGGGELLLELLSNIRDPDFFKVFTDLASAKAAVEKAKADA
jgi:hypothetical protein